MMNDSIDIWGKYDPNSVRIAKFYEKDLSQLAAGRKVVDTYHAFVTGRASLYFSCEEHFGDLAKDDDGFTKMFIKSLFVRNAILQFGLSLDLSWQAVWAYIYPSSVKDFLLDNYEKHEKDCNRDNLIAQLDCCISQGCMDAENLKDIVKDFDNDENTKKLRTLYNYIKHRGDIFIKGLGENLKNQGILINGESLPVLSRQEYKLDELQLITYNYAIAFMEYFQKIVDIIISEEYRENNGLCGEFINAQLKMKEIYDTLQS